MDEPYYDDGFSESQGNIFPIIIIVGIIIIIIIYFAFFRGCKKTEYKKGDKCIPITECDEQKNQIELKPATRISDRQCGCPANTYNDMGDCKNLTECRGDQVEKTPYTSTSDRVCGCPSEEYESNGICTAVTNCQAKGKQTLDEYTDTTDRQCGDCLPGRYLLGDTCTVVRNCNEEEYELEKPTPTSDRICNVEPNTLQTTPSDTTATRSCTEIHGDNSTYAGCANIGAASIIPAINADDCKMKCKSDTICNEAFWKPTWRGSGCSGGTCYHFDSGSGSSCTFTNDVDCYGASKIWQCS